MFAFEGAIPATCYVMVWARQHLREVKARNFSSPYSTFCQNRTGHLLSSAKLRDADNKHALTPSDTENEEQPCWLKFSELRYSSESVYSRPVRKRLSHLGRPRRHSCADHFRRNSLSRRERNGTIEGRGDWCPAHNWIGVEYLAFKQSRNLPASTHRPYAGFISG